MTYDESDIPFDVSEETERLIVRHLDGEIGVAEQARLDQILADSEGARLLLAEYRHMDVVAVEAMQNDLAGYSATSAKIPIPTDARRVRKFGWRMIGACGTIAAAAAVAVVVMLNTGPRGSDVVHEAGGGHRTAPSYVQPDQIASKAAPDSLMPRIQKLPADGAPYGFATPVDLAEYRNVDHQPRHHFGNVYRDLIGIRGSNPNRIYILEREAQKTNAVLVSGDF